MFLGCARKACGCRSKASTRCRFPDLRAKRRRQRTARPPAAQSAVEATSPNESTIPYARPRMCVGKNRAKLRQPQSRPSRVARGRASRCTFMLPVPLTDCASRRELSDSCNLTSEPGNAWMTQDGCKIYAQRALRMPYSVRLDGSEMARRISAGRVQKACHELGASVKKAADTPVTDGVLGSVSRPFLARRRAAGPGLGRLNVCVPKLRIEHWASTACNAEWTGGCNRPRPTQSEAVIPELHGVILH